MSEQIIAAIISIVTAIGVSIVGYLFMRARNRAEIEKLRAEAETQRAETEKIRVETEKLRHETKELQDKQDWLEAETEEIKQVLDFPSYHGAFPEMVKLIEDHLIRCKTQGEDQIVTLKLIAVAMTFSWDNFVMVDLARLIKEYNEAIFKIDVLFVDHVFLAGQPVADIGIDWVSRARQRIDDVKAYAADCKRFYHGRVHFRARTYKNLPHWHGWLINENHLFLGRTDWEHQVAGAPVLRVGQNKYRRFSSSTNEGKERVDLFKSWQKFYFEFSSENVCDTTENDRK